MADKFAEPIAALRTYAITLRRDVDKKIDEAEALLAAARAKAEEANSYEQAADLLAGPKSLTPEEEKALAEIVREFSQEARRTGGVFPFGFKFRGSFGGLGR